MIFLKRFWLIACGFVLSRGVNLFFFVYMSHFDIILGSSSCSLTLLPQIIIFCNSHSCTEVPSVFYWIQTRLDFSVLAGWKILSKTFEFSACDNILDLQFPKRYHWVITIIVPILLSPFITLETYSCPKPYMEKNSTSHISVREERLLSNKHNMFMQEMVLLLILASAS